MWYLECLECQRILCSDLSLGGVLKVYYLETFIKWFGRKGLIFRGKYTSLVYFSEVYSIHFSGILVS